MTETSKANRRIHTRYKSQIPGRLLHDGDPVEGRVENVGVGGVFFATEDLELAVEESSRVTVSFDCRRDGVLALIERVGVVLRTERYFDGESVIRAFAIKFDELIDLEGVEFD
jgi:hypothetical protein